MSTATDPVEPFASLEQRAARAIAVEHGYQQRILDPEHALGQARGAAEAAEASFGIYRRLVARLFASCGAGRTELMLAAQPVEAALKRIRETP